MSYLQKNGLARDIGRIRYELPLWIEHMRPHFRRLFTSWNVPHNFVNICVEAPREPESASWKILDDGDFSWLWGHMVAVSVFVLIVLAVVL